MFFVWFLYYDFKINRGYDVWFLVYKYIMVGVYEVMGFGEIVDRIISILVIDYSFVWILISWLKN